MLAYDNNFAKEHNLIITLQRSWYLLGRVALLGRVLWRTLRWVALALVSVRRGLLLAVVCHTY